MLSSFLCLHMLTERTLKVARNNDFGNHVKPKHITGVSGRE